RPSKTYAPPPHTKPKRYRTQTNACTKFVVKEFAEEASTIISLRICKRFMTPQLAEALDDSEISSKLVFADTFF
ncbi:unnamed protein product, partial [Ceratitis capitata]